MFYLRLFGPAGSIAPNGSGDAKPACIDLERSRTCRHSFIGATERKGLSQLPCLGPVKSWGVNLFQSLLPEEVDSYLYQTAGQDAVEFTAQALDAPLCRKQIDGTTVGQGSEYGLGRQIPPERSRVTGRRTSLVCFL